MDNNMSQRDVSLSIYKAIEASGLTREYIAFTVGVSLRVIYFWQSGQKMPSLENAIKLASTLRCTLDRLLFGAV